MKWVIYKYKDGISALVQWDDLYDGEWPYGDLNEKVIYKDINFNNEKE